MLDLRLKREGNSTTTDMYRKPTHMDQFLLWNRNDPIQQKLGTISTLVHKKDTLIVDEERRRIQKEMVRVTLEICGYPEWAMKEGELRGKRQLRNEEEIQKGSVPVEDKKRKHYAVLRYMKGITQNVQRAFRKHISLYTKAGFTIRNTVVSLKGALDIDKQCVVIYGIACDVCRGDREIIK